MFGGGDEDTSFQTSTMESHDNKSDLQRGNSSQGGRPRCGTLKPTNVLSISYGVGENVSVDTQTDDLNPSSMRERLNKIANSSIVLGIHTILA